MEILLLNNQIRVSQEKNLPRMFTIDCILIQKKERGIGSALINSEFLY